MLPLKVLSWNVEHFDGKGGQDRNNRRNRLDRVERVVELVRQQDPDIFGIIEVEGAIVYDKITELMPGYTFNITEGRQSQEILIGVRGGLTAFFTQRNEFKRNNPYLRPGALLTVRDGNLHVPILFAHLKSMPSPEGFGLRDAMFDKIFDLKKELDKVTRRLSGNQAANSNFIVLGDLNTMGMDYYRSTNDIPGDREIDVLTAKFATRKMDRLEKSAPFTWYNGSTSSYPPSNLDHVFAAQHLEFEAVDGGAAVVEVGGWAERASVSERDDWISSYSDHAPLTFTLTSV